MLFLVSLALAAGFCALCRKALLKRPAVFTAVFTALALAAAFLPTGWMSPWARQNVAGLFQKGYLATALFAVVMLTGALKNGSGLMKALMPVRGQLSVCAGILMLGHYISCGVGLFTAASHGSATAMQTVSIVLAALMLALLLPLWVTSFPAVRAKMGHTRWKRLQRWAYGFYALMFAHMLTVAVPHALAGGRGYALSAGVYALVFLGYAALRLRKARGKSGLAVPAAVGVCAGALCLVLLTSLAAERSTPPQEAAQTPAAQTQSVLPDPNPPVQSASPVAEPSGSAEKTPPETAEKTPEQAAGPYADGTYTGEAMGYNGPVTVSVTVENGWMTDIAVVSSTDTAGYFDDAAAGVLPAMLEAQSTWVDAVTGATTSSWGLMDAAQAALDKAG